MAGGRKNAARSPGPPLHHPGRSMRAPWGNPWSSPRWGALACALVAFAIHVNSFQNQFAYDDVQILTENRALHDIRNLPGLLAQPYWPGIFGKEMGLWRPGTTLTFGIEWAFFQDHGSAYHVVNVLAHAVATALGRGPHEFVLESYRALFVQTCEAIGTTPTDMIFAR